MLGKSPESTHLDNTLGTGENGPANGTVHAVNNTLNALGFTQRYPFIRHDETTGNIVVNLEGSTNNLESFSGKRLQDFVDNLFTVGYKLVGLDSIILETLIHETPEEIQDMGYARQVTIAKGIATVNRELIKQLYTGNRIHGYGDSCEKTASKDSTSASVCFRWTSLMERDITKIKQLVGEANFSEDLSFDDFFVFLWTNGIRYGIDQNAIAIHLRKKGTRRNLLGTDSPLRVASPKAAVEPTDDTLDMRRSLVTSKKPLVNKDGRANMKRTEYSFPQAKKDDILLVIKRGAEGKSGIGVNGEVILPTKKAVRYSIESMLSLDNKLSGNTPLFEGGENFIVTSEVNPGVIEIRVNDDVFISKSKSGKYILGKEIINKTSIGVESGSIEVENKNSTFHQMGNIQHGYYLAGWNVKVSKSDVNGEIIGEQHVTIDSSTLSGARVISREGNILIKKDANVHTHSEITAVNGTVIVEGNLEHTTIKADKIIIQGKANGCTLIGREVSVAEGQKNTIAAETIRVGRDISTDTKSESSYIVLIPYAVRNYIRTLDKKIGENRNNLKRFNEELITKKAEWGAESNGERKKIIANEGARIKKRVDDTTGFLEHDEALLSSIQTLIPSAQDSISITFSTPGDHSGNMYIFPINFILEEDLYKVINPSTPKDERGKKKLADFGTLSEQLQKILSPGGEGGGIRLKREEDRIVLSRESCIKQLEEALEQKGGNSFARMDSHREVLLEREDAESLFNGKSQKPRLIPPISVTVEGNENCFLGDISEKGSSFYIPKDLSHIEKNSKISVRYTLPNGDKEMVNSTGFRVARVEEFDTFIKVSGEYTDSGFEGVIAKFLNYVAGKKKEAGMGRYQ